VIELATLHRHWITADSIKQFIFADVPNAGKVEMSSDNLELAQKFSSFMRLSVWYALLYVVIEGYQELKQTDEKVDALLAKSDYVDALRRFRNATFHYQRHPFPAKLMTFLLLPDATDWARALNRSFENFFMRVLPIQEALDRLRDDLHA
jgi:hypothetical protein